MNTFEKLLLLPGAAPILADKLSGRIVSRVADGFDQDPALGYMMNLFRSIEFKWPKSIMSLREMYEVQLNDASKDSTISTEAMGGLTAEQRAVWESEPTRNESRENRLKEALPKIVDLYAEAEPIYESWDDLEPINQWSLLNAVERGLQKRLERYKAWAKEDEDKGRTESNAITLRNDANDAVVPLHDLITEFLDDPVISDSLERDAANGIRVPVRQVA